jgi:sugar/nucleoside kinase (ribokinase family)
VAGREPSPLVCALGDLVLDVIVRHEQALVPGDDVPAVTHIGPGGQAANVAAWASALGGRGRWLGKRGDDAAAALVAAEADRLEVDLRGPVVRGRTGVVVSLVDGDGRRTMASDRGVSAQLSAHEVDPAWLDGCQTLHVSGYALAAEPIATAAEQVVALAHERGLQVSADVSAATLVDEPFRRRLDRVRPDVLFATEEEREALGDELPAPTWILKRGPRGCVFSQRGIFVELPAAAGEVVDSTGAGDALAAGFLLGGPLDRAARRGLDAAARCLGRLGSMP